MRRHAGGTDISNLPNASAIKRLLLYLPKQERSDAMQDAWTAYLDGKCAMAAVQRAANQWRNRKAMVVDSAKFDLSPKRSLA
jgi:hypothetical protein